MRKEKVLITGGAGYIGSVLTEELLKEGYEVTCLDNLSLKQNSLINYAYHSDFEFIYGDCRDEKLLEKIIPKFDVIIPLAAVVGMPACNARPFDAKTINYEAIVLLAQKIKKYIPKFEIIEKEIEEDPDKRNYIVSNKRLENAGFKAKISLDEGIKELIKTYNVLLHNDPYKNI
jgi:nucleoside-diphosphate-sugar epimerase